jgi:hypothetical protein
MTRLRRLVACAAMVVATVSGMSPRTLRAQRPMGCGPGRVFYLDQRSYWLSDGVDPRAVEAADTAVTMAPDSSTTCGLRQARRLTIGSERGTGQVEAQISRPEGPPEIAAVTREEGMTMMPDELPEYYLTRGKGSLIAEVAAWLTFTVPREGRPLVDTLVSTHTSASDTVAITRIRHLLHATPHSPRDAAWVEMRTVSHVRLVSSHVIEWHLYPRGTRLHVLLDGDLQERFLVGRRSGQVDSLSANGRLSGWLVFAEADGRVDSVHGSWTVRRTGDWREDPGVRSAREMKFFMVHGRDSAVATPATQPAPTLIDSLVAAVENGDSTSRERLLRLRELAPDPFARRSIDSALESCRLGAEEMDALARGRLRYLRAGDAPTLEGIVRSMHYGRRGAILAPDLGAALVGSLASLRVERAQMLDREELFAHLLPEAEGPRFDSATAAILAMTARSTDDPLARDLLLLQAYRSSPAEYRGLVERLADSVRGYGYIARQYVRGNTGLLNWSWGWRPEWANLGMTPAADTWPGLDAPWRAYGRRRIGELREWFAAHRLVPGSWARGRFDAEPDPEGRLVWAGYLLELGDSTSLPWLRQAADADSGHFRELAIGLMEAHGRMTMDTVRDDSTLSELEHLLLTYAADGGGLVDTAGQAIAPFGPHDERPDRHFILDERLTPTVRDHWGQRFRLITADSLKALANREGLQMALVIHPVTRLGRRFFTQISLNPWAGQSMCLCGGGTELSLERRGGRWVVISSLQWVS